MGVSVEQWRAAVGCWRSGARLESTSPGRSWRHAGSARDEALAQQRFWLVVLAALLVIGGVELNPGPPVGKKERNPSGEDRAKDLIIKSLQRDLKQQEKIARQHNEIMQSKEQELEELLTKIQQKDQQLVEMRSKERKRCEDLEEIRDDLTKERKRCEELEEIIDRLKIEQVSPLQTSISDSCTSTRLRTASVCLGQPPDPSSTLLPYKTTSSKADGAGLEFEVKMLALVFLRAINKNYEFFLASNLEEAGAFDDIVLKHRINERADWSTTFIQLKHKQSDFVTRSKLLSLGKNKNDFSLIKYCKSYKQIKGDCTTKSDLRFLGNFDKYEFVLYTNAEAGKEIEKCEPADRECGLDMSAMLSTNPEEDVVLVSDMTNGDVLEGLKEIVSFKELLTDLNSSNQSKTSEITKKLNSIDGTVNRELYAKCEQLKKNIDSQDEVEKILQEMDNVVDISLYQEFLEKLLIFTGQASEKELDEVIKNEIEQACQTADESEIDSLFDKIVEEVKLWWKTPTGYFTHCSSFWKTIMIDRIDRLSLDKHQQFKMLKDIIFDNDSINIIKNIVRGTRILNVNTNGTFTSLACLKVYQALSCSDDQNCIVIGIQQLQQRSEQILAAWQNKWCRTLIIECDAALGNDYAKELAASLQAIVNVSDDIKVVLITSGNHVLAEHLERDMNYDEHPDSCRWSDLQADSQTFLLKRIIDFQGYQVPLSSIIDDEKRLTKRLKGDTLYQLVTGKRSFGITLDTDVKYYIPRKLSRKNCTSKIDSYEDVNGKTFLLTAEPGMGKTTLTTHVAISAKKLDPTKWVVRINLNDCSNYLNRKKNYTMDLKTSIDFIRQFGLKEEDRTVLEEILFEHCLMSRGRMLIFIDAVDEVCPDYEETVLSLIGHLVKNTRIQLLWVTSRVGEKVKLEETMDDKAFSLEPFVEKDQHDFLNTFWKIRLSDLDLGEQQLNEFTDKVLQLVKQAFQGENLVIGIPQQTMMLGEYFEEQLVIWKETDMCNLSERLNLFTLYDSFVRKTYVNYSSDKKKENLSNVAVINDNAEHFGKFIRNHKHAALILLLSSSELSSLDVIGDAQTETFLKSIKEGREKTGIIDNIVNEKPSFIHRTFAEYFAALWFTDNFTARRTFLENKLFTSEFVVIKEIFDLQLSAKNDLNTAVLSRVTATFTSLLSSGVDVNATDAGGRTALHLASSYKHSNMKHIVKELLRKEASVNIQDFVMQWRPLQYADRTSSWTIAGLLLRNGADVNDLVTTKANMTPEVFSLLIDFITNNNAKVTSLMFSAAYHGELDVVKYLVTEHNANVHFHDNARVAYMHKAAEGGQTEVLRYLESEGVSYRVKDSLNTVPILYAAKQGHQETMMFLCFQKASIKLGDVKDLTEEQRNISMVLAAFLSNVKLAKALRDNNASVYYSDSKDTTALHWAAYKNNLEMVTLLLKMGAQVNAQDDEGRTPLVRSVEKKMTYEQVSSSLEGNYRLKLVKLLVNNGAFITGVPNSKSHDICMYAQKNGHLDVATYFSREIDEVTNELLNYLNVKDSDGSSYNTYNIQQCIERGASLRIASDKLNMPYAVVAARFGTVFDLECALETCHDIDIRSANGRTPLLLSIDSKSIEKIKFCLEKGADVKATDLNANTVLHHAVDTGITDIVEIFVGLHADVDARNRGNISPLRWAVRKGFLEIAKYLIDRGSVVNGEKTNETTALHEACTRGNLDVVKLLIRNNALIDVRDTNSSTPLMIAVAFRHFEIVEYLLDSGADMAAVDREGDPLLNRASFLNCTKIVELLLKRGFCVDSVTNSGTTSLMFAAMTIHVDPVTNSGMTSSMLAAFTSSRVKLLPILLDSGANIEAVCHNLHRTALHYAVETGSYEAVQYLIEKGANVKALDIKNMTILHLAAGMGHLDILEYIVQKNYFPVDVNTPGCTPLLTASTHNKLDCVEYLIAQGASVNKIDSGGSSALHYATMWGNLKLVKCLLKRKAPLDLMNKCGETPLDLAIKYGHNDVVKYLNIVIMV